MKMRALLAVSAAAVIAAGPSLADPVGGYNWNGGYFGFNLGHAGGKAKHPFSIVDTPTDTNLLGGSADVTASGFVGGIQLGWNFQSGSLVYGIEGDIQGSGVKGEVRVGGSTDLLGGHTFSGEAGTKVKYFGTLRGRVGQLVNDNFLVYGTAGVATGKVESYFAGAIDGSGIADSNSKTKTGWTIGVGAEYALGNGWSFKTEYLYTDLGKSSILDGDIGSIHGNLSRKVAFHTVRAGLNFRF